MHRPELYRYHKLHHKFHMHVTPLAANCVTIVEYVVAYMLPFVAGIFFFRPDRACAGCRPESSQEPVSRCADHH